MILKIIKNITYETNEIGHQSTLQFNIENIT